MKARVKKMYRGSELQVYLICILAWSNYLERIISFSNFNGKYTHATEADAIAAAAAAAALPGASVRQAAARAIRGRLEKKGKLCINYWQMLARYIDNCFAADAVRVMKQEAGARYYAAAGKLSWKQLSALNMAAIAFMAKYSADLQMQGQGMPADFATKFGTAKTDFDALLKQYNDAKQEVMQQTAAKTTAFNAVYLTLSNMLKDGKTIFSNDAQVKNLFVYNSLVKLVGKSSKTGLHIQVLDRITMLPVTNTTFTIQPGNITAFVNANGVADVLLPAGVYSYVATTPGYPTVSGGNMVAKAGTMRRVELLLEKAVAVA